MYSTLIGHMRRCVDVFDHRQYGCTTYVCAFVSCFWCVRILAHQLLSATSTTQFSKIFDETFRSYA